MQKSIFHGLSTQHLDGDQINDMAPGLLDTGKVNYLVPMPAWKAALADIGIEKGKAYSEIEDLFIKDMKLTDLHAGHATVDISLEGILDGNGDKRLRTISAFGSVVSIGPIEETQIVIDGQDEAGDDIRRRVPKVNNVGEPVYTTISTPSGAASRWNILDAGVTVVDTYFVRVEPKTEEIGTAQTPTNAPTVPPWIWGGYSQPTRSNHPQGWVLADRQVTPLYAADGTIAGLWKVVDTYDYYYPSTPD